MNPQSPETPDTPPIFGGFEPFDDEPLPLAVPGTVPHRPRPDDRLQREGPSGESEADRASHEARMERLVEQSRRGDPSAFDAVAAEFAAPLLRFSTAVLSGDGDAAHDIVQEVLLAAWQSLPTLEEPRYLRAWLFRVAHRRAISFLRRRGRGERGEGVKEDEGKSARVSALPARGDPPSKAEEVDASSGMRAMLDDIPERYASPIVLCYLEGLGLRETARVLDVTVSTLKMRLHRGRLLLRRRLAEEERWLCHRRPSERADEQSLRVRRDDDGYAGDLVDRPLFASSVSPARCREGRRFGLAATQEAVRRLADARRAARGRRLARARAAPVRAADRPVGSPTAAPPAPVPGSRDTGDPCVPPKPEDVP